MVSYQVVSKAVLAPVIFGVLTAVLWATIGDRQFAEVWPGYKDHVDSAFWVGTLVSAAAMAYLYLKRSLHSRGRR